jgi:hypothetical protein
MREVVDVGRQVLGFLCGGAAGTASAVGAVSQAALEGGRAHVVAPAGQLARHTAEGTQRRLNDLMRSAVQHAYALPAQVGQIAGELDSFLDAIHLPGVGIVQDLSAPYFRLLDRVDRAVHRSLADRREVLPYATERGPTLIGGGGEGGATVQTATRRTSGRSGGARRRDVLAGG